MAHALSTYQRLIDDLKNAGYYLHPIRHYFEATGKQSVVYLRHDVDRLPQRAVTMAEAEAERGIRATYYFRCDARLRFPEQAMRLIASLGHETGFHYESLSRTRGDRAAALALFERELAACRAIVPVSTVAPHGAPLSRSSNMDFSVSSEAVGQELLGDATDMDDTDMLYVTDTGGTFGSRYNLRDRLEGRCLTKPMPPARLAKWVAEQGITQLTLSCHPERWPVGGLGLMQAWVTDVAANAAKLAARRVKPVLIAPPKESASQCPRRISSSIIDSHSGSSDKQQDRLSETPDFSARLKKKVN